MAAALDLARPALSRLIAIASHGTSQARRAANLLFAWADAAAYGGFDPMELAEVDAGVARDMLALIAQAKLTPAALGVGETLAQLATQWRRPQHALKPATAAAGAVGG